MGHDPEITIITVVYNAERHLEETIQSVLAHTYENLSYIVIDGGSTDGSVDIIKKYRDRISYWVSEKDLGIYDAMNKGWNAAAEDSFILFLGAGDRLISLPDNMQELSSADVVYGKVRFGEDKIFISKTGPILKLFNTLHHQALLIKKSVHPGAPFDLQYTVYADFDFNQRLWKSRARFLYSDELIGYALPGGLSSRYAVRESFNVIRSNYGLWWSVCFLLLYAASAAWGVVSPFKPYSALKSS